MNEISMLTANFERVFSKQKKQLKFTEYHLAYLMFFQGL